MIHQMFKENGSEIEEIFSSRLDFVSLYCFGSVTNQYGFRYTKLFKKEFESMSKSFSMYYWNLFECHIEITVDMFFGWLLDTLMESFGGVKYPLHLKIVCKQILNDIQS